MEKLLNTLRAARKTGANGDGPISTRTAALARSFEPYLDEWGYGTTLVRHDYEFGQAGECRRVALAAFAHVPLDARTACIAVVEAEGPVERAVANCLELGAPVVFVCHEDGVEWWKQSSKSPSRERVVSADGLESFLRDQSSQQTFEPRRLYRAKTQGRIDPQLRLSFVDELLMPTVERFMGQRLGEFINNVFEEARQRLARNTITDQMSHQLLRDTFWLVAAKILHDKNVPSFANINLREIDQVFRKVRDHYGEPAQLLHAHRALRMALTHAAEHVARLGFLGQVTTEALAQVYEQMLVTPELRKAFGIHCTPPYLVEYILARLDEWISEMNSEARHVFEPASGHGAFLVAAMRRLRDLLPVETDSHDYLRERLQGLEIDDIAREISRLSLTLADIPNPDGWQLNPRDMFEGDVLQSHARQAMILLANPPFENFTPAEQAHYSSSGTTLSHLNKAAEMLSRTLPHLPAGAIFGVIVPQGLLHGADSLGLRKRILSDFELHEVLVLPDKVFAFADVEAAVLIGRKHTPAKNAVVRYRQVREPDIVEFRDRYTAHSDRQFAQSEFSDRPDADLRMPDLEDVWAWPTGRKLGDIANVGQGLVYKSKKKGINTCSPNSFPGAVRGYMNVGRNLQLHGRPTEVWMSIDSRALRRPQWGTTTGTPQVLVNYHPVSRGPWRLKAVLDADGHAVSSSFLVVRPTQLDVSLELLWAICNSPYANAYAYTHATKRDIAAGIMREMFVPRHSAGEAEQVVAAVRAYLGAVEELEAQALRHPSQEENCRQLLLEVDALVLRMYNLPGPTEGQLLKLLREARAGIPFPWEGYYPDNSTDSVPFYVYRSAVRQRRPSAARASKRKQPASRKAKTFSRSLGGLSSEPMDALEESVGTGWPLPIAAPVVENIKNLYEELAGLDQLRTDFGSTPELEARAAAQYQRLRQIQDEQARIVSEDFRKRHLMPPEEGPDLIDKIARVLEVYGDPSGRDKAISATDSKKA